MELLAEGGPTGVSMASVAARAGVARATVYLRWPSRDALLAAAARYAFGRPPFPLTGEIATDLRSGTREARLMIGQPAFAAIFPELVRALLTGNPGATYDLVAPNRRQFAEEYRSFAAEQGFRTDVDPTLAFDLIAGSILNHLLATGTVPTAQDADRIGDVILAGLRAQD
jgi:AcrR family transcriptional regulator